MAFLQISVSDPRITTVPQKYNLIHLAVVTGGTDDEFKKVIQRVKDYSRYSNPYVIGYLYTKVAILYKGMLTTQNY